MRPVVHLRPSDETTSGGRVDPRALVVGALAVGAWSCAPWPDAPWSDAPWPWPAGTLFATTTIAGRSSRPFSVQAGVQAWITVPGGCSALSCSAIAWCRFGSNTAPVGSSRLMPLRSRRPRSCARRPRSPRAACPPGPARRRTAAAALSSPRRMLSAASATSRANFCTAYCRVSSTSRLVRARRLAISASERSHLSCISSRSACERGEALGGVVHHLVRRLAPASAFVASGEGAPGIRFRCP